MPTQKPVKVIRKSSGNTAGRTAAQERLARQRAERAAVQSAPDRLPGGIGFNGDLVQTPNGPVWVPHGEADPANALEMRAGPAASVGLGQPQLDPNSNLRRYQANGRLTDPTPPMPANFDFPNTYDPNPGQTPTIGGYNGMPPPASNPFNPNVGPQPGPQQPPPPGMGPPAPGGAPPGPAPGAPGAGPGAPGGPNNPFDPNVGPPAPGAPIGIPNQPSQLQGLLAAYGYTTGPNGELLPIHLRQGASPFQNQPGQQQHPGYTVPGFG